MNGNVGYLYNITKLNISTHNMTTNVKIQNLEGTNVLTSQ